MHDPINEAVESMLRANALARQIDETFAANVNNLAKLLAPHIRSLNGYRAMELKAALRDLDGRTGRRKR